MCLNSSMQVGDHDYTMFDIICLVCFIVDIPDVIQQSWYNGQGVVGLKESTFELSSPLCHSTYLKPQEVWKLNLFSFFTLMVDLMTDSLVSTTISHSTLSTV